MLKKNNKTIHPTPTIQSAYQPKLLFPAKVVGADVEKAPSDFLLAITCHLAIWQNENQSLGESIFSGKGTDCSQIREEKTAFVSLIDEYWKIAFRSREINSSYLIFWGKKRVKAVLR